METQDRQIPKIALRAFLTGAPLFHRSDGSVLPLPERRHKALLAYLVVRADRPQSRESLAALFWPNGSPDATRANLRQALSVLRRALGPEAAALIESTRDRVVLHGAGVQTDLDPQEGTDGAFLDGLSGFSAEFDSWRAAQQNLLSERTLRWLMDMAALAQSQRRTLDAISHLVRATGIDPFDESAQRQLMSLYLAHGRTGEALRVFDRLAERLKADLGVRPEQATLDLVHDIRSGRNARQVQSPAEAPTDSRAPPPTRYARSGGCNIAFQVSGSGPVDLVLVQGWVSNLDFAWTHPAIAGFYDRLGRFSRLIRLDKRGTGLSDRDVGLPDLAERMADLTAVMDAAGSRKAFLFGTSEGGNLCLLFAATYPERVAGLVLYGAYARGLWAEDYPWAKTQAELEDELAAIAREWGGPFDLSKGSPSFDADEAERRWFAAYGRASASPQDAIKAWRWGAEVDQRALLREVAVPTLVLHRSGDRWAKVEEGRYLAKAIPNAAFEEFAGEDHLIWAGNNAAIFDRVEVFVASLAATHHD
jgi:DNA-binding SARP family transcriptional activator/pimeloyl-ACP methyl ester carboxylesterase